MERKNRGAIDPSQKLYEVLVDEYDKLGIISTDQRIKMLDEMYARFSGLDWFDYKMNDWVQAQRLKFIREKLNEFTKPEGESESPEQQTVPSALCFSGGGIRSATFCLGVLQGLAKYGLLDKFDYLSTVSGGGYIGSWFSAWIDRAGSVEKVQASLTRDPANPYLFELKDFNIDFENISDSLKTLSAPVKSTFDGASKLSADEKRRIDEFFVGLDEMMKSGTEDDSVRIKTRNLFKDLCKSLNRQILLERTPDRRRSPDEKIAEAKDSEKFRAKRFEFERAISRILNSPALLTEESFFFPVTKKVLTGELELERKKEEKNEVRIRFFEEIIEKLGPTTDRYFEAFLSELNGRIRAKKISIEMIKERGRLHYLLEPLTVPYVESDLLQNSDTANMTAEPEQITHLRSYSNYMSPKLGLFSTDTFSLVTLYLRNLLLNWLVFVPLIAAILLIPRILKFILEKRSIFSQFENLIPVKWLAFLGHVRADVHQLFLRITPSEIDPGILLLFLVLFGIFGVYCINYLRPSLSKKSGFKQNYTVGKIGVVKTVERQVIKYCIVPVSIIAFGLPVYLKWLHDAKLDKMHDKYSFVYLGVFLFTGGFLIARILIYLANRLKIVNPEKDTETLRQKDNIFKEFATSLASGIIGGLTLYFLTERFVSYYKTFELDANSVYISFAGPIFLTAFLVAATVFVGIASKITDDMDREWMNRFGAMLLKIMLAWIVIACTVLLGEPIFELIGNLLPVNAILASIGGISGLITLALGFSSSSTEDDPGTNSTWKSVVFGFAPQVAAPVFILFLIGLIAFLTEKLMIHTNILNPWIWFVGLAGFGALMGKVININKFSLHAMYRERLIRTYLGASRIKERFKTANSFTDLDLNDNVEMKYLFQKPFHVVNMTLNLVKTDNLKWQDRKAESFTATALFCGSSNMGNGTGHYRDSKKYGVNEQNGRSITLGTAAAISGAAASPNMGYFTVSSAVSFLMTLFNIRLGWWLGNPGKSGEQTYMLASPAWSPSLLLAEATGGTTDIYPYIYVSDGGHFENLGIYEMVLRRCKLIFAIDSGADPKFSFSDLGNAIHKIRVDMGVSINFRSEPTEGNYCALADIKYPEIDASDQSCDGILIYIKPTLDGSEPIDIKQYKIGNKLFPHEPTADQMYSETQFESYRTLGFHVIDKVCGSAKIGKDTPDLQEIIDRAVKYTESKKKAKKKSSEKD